MTDFPTFGFPMRMTFSLTGVGLFGLRCCCKTPSFISFFLAVLFSSDATFRTSTVEFHPMMKDLKTVTLGNPVLKGFKSSVLELNNLSAIETDQVIVMASFEAGSYRVSPSSNFRWVAKPSRVKSFRVR